MAPTFSRIWSRPRSILWPSIPEQSGAVFNWRFFRESPNVLADLLPDSASYADYVRVIDVPAVARGRFLEVIMDDEESKALGYLSFYPRQRT